MKLQQTLELLKKINMAFSVPKTDTVTVDFYFREIFKDVSVEDGEKLYRKLTFNFDSITRNQNLVKLFRDNLPKKENVQEQRPDKSHLPLEERVEMTPDNMPEELEVKNDCSVEAQGFYFYMMLVVYKAIKPCKGDFNVRRAYFAKIGNLVLGYDEKTVNMHALAATINEELTVDT